MLEPTPDALVECRGSSSRDYTGDVAARVPWIARVHAQHIQHIPEVEADSRHPQRHLVGRQRGAQPAQCGCCSLLWQNTV
jgi:hypothetical protein